jgi:hypothetical protein
MKTQHARTQTPTECKLGKEQNQIQAFYDFTPCRLIFSDFSKVCNAITFRDKQYKNGLSTGLLDPEHDTNVGNFSMKSDRSRIYSNTSARTSDLLLCFFRTHETCRRK